MTDLKQDPHMAYSDVHVHVTDTEVLLRGTVKTQTAKDQAAKIAGAHAAKRKITNRIKVNSSHPQVCDFEVLSSYGQVSLATDSFKLLHHGNSEIR